MATWDITAPAGSGVGEAGSASSGITPPGDFDGATIDSVAVVGTPALNSDGTTDDTLGIRWRIQTTGGVSVYGDFGSDAASLCSAVLGDSVSSDTIQDGSSPSPAPSTAVAADWDEIAYSANYAGNMKNDAETCSWSAFTVRVTYTANADTEVAANVAVLTLTENPASISLDVNVSASVSNLTLTTHPATIAFGTDVQASVAVLTLTEHQATVTLDVNVQCGVTDLTLSGQQASITFDRNVLASVTALSLTEYQATISLDGEGGGGGKAYGRVQPRPMMGKMGVRM